MQLMIDSNLNNVSETIDYLDGLQIEFVFQINHSIIGYESHLLSLTWRQGYHFLHSLFITMYDVCNVI